MIRHRRSIPLVLLLAASLASAPLAAAKPIAKARWLGKVTVTEYYPTPESWFVGKPVAAPGLTTKHRIDWLYSARGVSMQGTGIGLDGQLYHIDALGQGGWVDDHAHPISAGRKGWSGIPYWRAGGYWLSRKHQVTFPLAAGGWSNGRGKRYVALTGVSFAAGPSKPLRPWRSIAVDPRVIPLGSRVYIDAYRTTPGHGWFIAQDVGGAIVGRHVDVYRSPPATPTAGASYLASQRIYVIPPGKHPGADAPGRTPPPPSGDTPQSGGGAGTTDGSAAQAGSSGGAGAP